MDPLLGSIILFAGNFNPRGWALCQGQILAISTNSALFAILGTTYGGNGQTTFALPDLRGRAPIGQGQGPGLSGNSLGEQAGTEQVTITINQMPAHNHPVTVTAQVSNSAANSDDPENSFLTTTNSPTYATTGNPGSKLGGLSGTVGNAGNSQPLPIRNPYLVLNYIIALEGVFPSRN